MDLRYVETFYRAAMLGSTAAAAAELHIVPRAATKRIQVLEDELGTKLLERSAGKRLRLTPAGTRLFHEAKRLLDLWLEIRVEIGESCSRPLRVGAIESVLHSWLIPWVRALRREQPALQFELTVDTTPDLVDLLRRGALDLTFATEPLRANGVRTREVDKMSMVFAGASAMRRRRTYTLEQLAGCELLTFQRNSLPNLDLLEQLREAGLMEARVHAVSSISAMASLSASGFGVATLPRAVVERLGPDAGLSTIGCRTRLRKLPIHVSWLDDPTSSALDTIVESAIAFTALPR